MLAAETKVAVGATATELSAESPFVWKQIAEPVEAFIHGVAARLAEQLQTFDPDIATYIEYALARQGKQLRPALVGLSARAAGDVNDAHVTVAVIIEMVHLATLVHDDVMDEAEIRRGRPTLAANWGNEISVLVGDCLFAHALKLAAGFPTPEICRAVAASTQIVCAGEILQTKWRRNFQLSRRQYFKVLEMKTAELFALSCDLGAALSGAAVSQRTPLRHYGLALGTAYQLYDDCLDLFGLEATAGKSLGTDLAKGKLTLPILLLWERIGVRERARLQKLIQTWEPRHFPQLLEFLERHEALPGCREVIHEYLHVARRSLDALSPSESRVSLQVMTDYLAQQTDALRSSS